MIVIRYGVLDGHAALHGIGGSAEYSQHAIPCGFYVLALVELDRPFQQAIVQPHHRAHVSTRTAGHLLGEVDDISNEYSEVLGSGHDLILT
jgi:hypothetical protein